MHLSCAMFLKKIPEIGPEFSALGLIKACEVDTSADLDLPFYGKLFLYRTFWIIELGV